MHSDVLVITLDLHHETVTILSFQICSKYQINQLSRMMVTPITQIVEA